MYTRIPASGSTALVSLLCLLVVVLVPSLSSGLISPLLTPSGSVCTPSIFARVHSKQQIWIQCAEDNLIILDETKPVTDSSRIRVLQSGTCRYGDLLADEARNRVYVACGFATYDTQSGASLMAYDLNGQNRYDIDYPSGSSWPCRLTMLSTGQLVVSTRYSGFRIVTNPQSSSARSVSTLAAERCSTITADETRGVAVDPSDSTFIIVSCLSGSVYRVPLSGTAGKTTLLTTGTAPAPYTLRYDAAGTLWATSSKGLIRLTRDGTITNLLQPTQCGQPWSMVTDSEGVMIVTCLTGKGLVQVNGTTVTSLATDTQLQGDGRGILYDPTSKDLFALYLLTGVARLTASSPIVIAPQSVCGTPYLLWKNDTGNGDLFIPCYTEGGVMRYNAKANNGIGAITFLQSSVTQGVDFAYEPTTGRAWLTSFDSGTYRWNFDRNEQTKVLVTTSPSLQYRSLITSRAQPGTGWITTDTAAVYKWDINGKVTSDSSMCPYMRNSWEESNGNMWLSCSGAPLPGYSYTGYLAFRPAGATTYQKVLTATTINCSWLNQIAGDEVRRQIYLVCMSGETRTYNITSQQWTETIPMATCTARNVWFDAPTNLVYYACDQGVYSYSPRSNSYREVVPATICNNLKDLMISNGVLYASCRTTVIAMQPNFRCKAGQYAENQDCVDCPAGTWRPSPPDAVNATFDRSCRPCAPGTFSLKGAAICVPCPAGSKQLLAGASTCDTCTVGTFSGNNGQSTCDLCAIGKFASVTNSSQCPDCPTQQTSTAGSSYCLPCAGGYGIPEGSVACTQCSNGQYTVGAGMACKLAPAGTFVDPSSGPALAPALCEPGTFQNSTGATVCVKCSPGRFQSGQGKSVCINCAPGRFMNNEGATSCDPCQPGTAVSGYAALTCDSCSAGRFASASASATCLDCPSNQVSSQGASFCAMCGTGQERIGDSLVCTPCALGTVSPGGGESCQPTNPGLYAPTVGLGFAKACPVGRYTNSTGAATCDPCTVGYYQSAEGSLSCSPCRPGTYSDLTASSTCDSCIPGRASSSGASVCSLCSPGYFSSLSGSVECEPCESGRYTNTTEAVDCSPCHAGSFSGTQASQCTDCMVGRYSDEAGSRTCRDCPSGSAQSLSGATSCVPCDAGTYQPETRGASCPVCGAGRYAPLSGQNDCLNCESKVSANRTQCLPITCPPNWQYDKLNEECKPCTLGTQAPNGGSCATCVSGFYTPLPGIECISCSQSGMEGLFCTNGLASVKEGYWAFQVDIAVAQDSIAVLNGSTIYRQYRTAQCLPNLCKGAALQVSQPTPPEAIGTNTTMQLSTFVEGVQCEYPSVESPLCGACAPGYIPWGNECAKCDGPRPGVWFGCIVLSLVLVLVFLMGDTASAGFLDICLYFVQTSMLIVGPMRTWLAFLTFVNLKPTSSPECLTDMDPYEQVAFNLLMPVVLLVELFVIMFLHKMALPIVVNLLSNQEILAPIVAKLRPLTKFDRSPYVRCFFVLMSFSYTQVATAAISYLRCVKAGDVSVVFSAPAIDCHSGRYGRFLSISLIFLILHVIAFPLVCIIFLRTRKRDLKQAVLINQQWEKEKSDKLREEAEEAKKIIKQIRTRQTSKAAASTSQTNEQTTAEVASPSSHRDAASPQEAEGVPFDVPIAAALENKPEHDPNALLMIARYGPLFLSYRGGAWFWFSLTLLRRTIFVVIDVSLADQPVLKFMSFAFLCFYTLSMHMLVRPFNSKEQNLAETLSQSMLVTISILITANPPPYSPAVQLAIFFLIFPASIFLALLVFRELRPIIQAQLHKVGATAMQVIVEIHKKLGDSDSDTDTDADSSASASANSDPQVEIQVVGHKIQPIDVTHDGLKSSPDSSPFDEATPSAAEEVSESSLKQHSSSSAQAETSPAAIELEGDSAILSPGAAATVSAVAAVSPSVESASENIDSDASSPSQLSAGEDSDDDVTRFHMDPEANSQ